MFNKYKVELILITVVLLISIALIPKIHRTNLESMQIEASFERLTALVIEGYSVESIEAKEDYDFLLSMEYHTMRLLEDKIEGIEAEETIDYQRTKYTAERIITDIIKNRGEYDSVNGYAVILKNTTGRSGPGFGYAKRAAIPKNLVVQVIGHSPHGWYICKQLQETDENYMTADRIIFWIYEDYIEDGFLKDDSPDFLINDREVAEEYSNIVKSKEKRVNIFDIPSDEGRVIGYVMNNDILRLNKDSSGSHISHKGWVLVQCIPYYWDLVETGWIKEEYVEEISEKDDPNQIFISKDTIIYMDPDVSSEKLTDKYPELKKDAVLFLVHVIERKDEWMKISPGVNAFTGWIREKN